MTSHASSAEGPIVVFEAFHGGHYSNYLEAIVAFAEVESGLPSIVLVVSAENLRSREWAEQIGPKVDSVTVDASIPPLPHAIPLTLDVAGLKEYLSALRTLWTSFLSAIERHQPSRVVVPSADPLTTAAQLFMSRRQQALLASVQTIAVHHSGYTSNPVGASEHIKDRIYRRGWRRAPWSRLLMVNPMQISALATREPALSVGLCPDPVPDLVPYGRAHAAAVLGLDPSLTWFGFIGAMRERAAIPELVDGFLNAALPRDAMLLLAGTAEEHGDWLRTQLTHPEIARRIAHIDRHLSFEELSAAYALCDVVTPLYRKTHTLSANLMKAIKAGKPTVVSPSGFSRYMWQRFPIGVIFDGTDPGVFARALEFTPPADSTDVRRLVEFHQPNNFAATLLTVGGSRVPSPYSGVG